MPWTKKEDEAWAKNQAQKIEKLNKQAQEIKAEKFVKKGIKREVAEAMAEQNETSLKNLRDKLAGIEAPKEFPEGTGEVELSEEDIEEIK